MFVDKEIVSRNSHKAGGAHFRLNRAAVTRVAQTFVAVLLTDSAPFTAIEAIDAREASVAHRKNGIPETR